MKRNNPLILVIEDEPALRADIADELEHHGYDVLQAANGKEGFSVIEKASPDLIVCDINMPEQNGFELLKQVREAGARFADIPFLFLSALSAPVQVVDGITAGADDYIVKPVDYNLLLAKVKSHFDRNERLIKKWFEERLGAGVGGAVIIAVVIIGVMMALGLVSIVGLYLFKGFLEVEFANDYHLTDFF